MHVAVLTQTGLSNMIIMPTNNTGFDAGYLFGKYPGRLAHLHSASPNPKHRLQPRPHTKWALDNGVFGAFTSGREWSEEPFYTYLDMFSNWNPMWAVVPDWVGDRERTLELWHQHWPAVAAHGAPLAFAAQDGMTPADVPTNADVVFVGGSTGWKWRTLNTWTENFRRVHVGRVNSYRLLQLAEAAGAESCDGTGWFRSPKRTAELTRYLEDTSTPTQSQLALPLNN